MWRTREDKKAIHDKSLIGDNNHSSHSILGDEWTSSINKSDSMHSIVSDVLESMKHMVTKLVNAKEVMAYKEDEEKKEKKRLVPVVGSLADGKVEARKGDETAEQKSLQEHHTTLAELFSKIESSKATVDESIAQLHTSVQEWESAKKQRIKAEVAADENNNEAQKKKKRDEGEHHHLTDLTTIMDICGDW